MRLITSMTLFAQLPQLKAEMLTDLQLIEGSAANIEATRRTRELMLERLKGREAIIESVVPDWALGCQYPSVRP